MDSGAIWQELGDGVYRRRYEFLDQNIGVVLGETAALVVDTRANPLQAKEIESDLARLTPLPIGWVFNTHHHWDHTFGNQVFAGAQIWGHRRCASELSETAELMLEEVLTSWVPSEDHESYRGIVFTPPSELFETSTTIDLGNRVVELEYLGRGHTNNDAVLHAGEVTFAGDLVEQGGPPNFGDAFPVAWADTLKRLVEVTRSTVVPGHGDVVGLGYVMGALEQMTWLSDTARVALAHGLAADHVDLTGAPYPVETCRQALERAYAELSSSAKFSQ